MENKTNIDDIQKQIKKLSELNKKYKTDFKLSDTRLSFYCLNKGDAVFEILNEFTFPKLYNLDLRYNQIKNIAELTKANLNQLQILNLSENEIQNIDPLSESDLGNLIELFLFKNKINSIEILSKCRFNNLKILDLSNNMINSINIETFRPFTNLERLFLSENNLQDNKIFSQENSETIFANLKILYLSRNKIVKIFPFKCPNLEELILIGNQINDLESLSKSLFKNIMVIGKSNRKY